MHVMNSTPWAAIVDFYSELEQKGSWEVRPMVELVEALAASPYAAGLHGTTSLNRLLISQYPSFNRQNEVLEIWFDRPSQLFRFAYQASPYEQPHWETTVPPEEGFAKLEHFLRMQKWFVEYH